MAKKFVEFEGLKALVQKIGQDIKANRDAILGKADAVHDHDAVDVKFEDGKNLVEKIAEIEAGEADLEGYATEQFVNEALAGKVDVVEGSRLMSAEEAEKLAGLENYDDAELAGRVEALEDIDHSEFLKAADIEGLVDGDFVTSKIEEVVGAAPEALDTLKELADALGNDKDFASSMTEALAGKVNIEEGKVLIDAAEVERLAAVDNYDDAEVKGRLDVLEAIDHDAFLKEHQDISGKADVAALEELRAMIGEPAVEAEEERHEVVEEDVEGAKVVVADDAEDFDPETQIKVSDVIGEAEVGDKVVYVPAVEAKEESGMFQTIVEKVSEKIVEIEPEVATVEELLAMYEEVKEDPEQPEEDPEV